MLDIYSQFRDFHTFKRFKYLLGDWWNVDIFVVVQTGNRFFYDDISQIQNPIVQSLLKSPLFKNNFLGSLSTAISAKINSSSYPKLVPWKQTGMDLFVVPLVLKETPSGAFLVATGFTPKKGEELYQSLLYLDLSKKAIEQRMKALKKLSQTDEVYIQKMLKILAEEFFNLLQEKKKQEDLIAKLNHKNSHKSSGQLLGKSPAMQYIFNILKKIRNYDVSILIEGEHGTGKRLLAKTIHEQSSRAKKAFFVQNFSTFKGRLLELELFGYNRKAFPTARKSKKAMLEKVEGGTVFLNEIGNTSLDFQERLLRFLKEAVFFSEGNPKAKTADVRVLSASSKDLKALVKKGQFNKELYFAISAMVIKTPPLKHRKEDIPLLIQHFLERKSPPGKKLQFSSEAMRVLYNYSWPGNIRELENEAARLISLTGKGQSIISSQNFSPHIRNSISKWKDVFRPGKRNLKEALRSIEKQILLDCLKKNNWNKSRVAKLLGASRTSIVLKTKEYGIIKEEGA